MEYGCSLAETAKQLQVDPATVLLAMQKGWITTQHKNGRSILTQNAIPEYKLRSQR